MVGWISLEILMSTSTGTNNNPAFKLEGHYYIDIKWKILHLKFLLNIVMYVLGQGESK